MSLHRAIALATRSWVKKKGKWVTLLRGERSVTMEEVEEVRRRVREESRHGKRYGLEFKLRWWGVWGTAEAGLWWAKDPPLLFTRGQWAGRDLDGNLWRDLLLWGYAFLNVPLVKSRLSSKCQQRPHSKLGSLPVCENDATSKLIPSRFLIPRKSCNSLRPLTAKEGTQQKRKGRKLPAQSCQQAMETTRERQVDARTQGMKTFSSWLSNPKGRFRTKTRANPIRSFIIIYTTFCSIHTSWSKICSNQGTNDTPSGNNFLCKVRGNAAEIVRIRKCPSIFLALHDGLSPVKLRCPSMARSTKEIWPPSYQLSPGFQPPF